MSHPELDRSIWNALTRRQAALAVGTGSALRFAREIGPLAASADGSAAGLRDLAEPGEQLWTIEPHVVQPAAGLRLVRTATLDQMVMAKPPPAASVLDIVELGAADAAEMHALATLTAPGPFEAGTWRLGAFIGVRRDGRLAAMAGERTRPGACAEVSGVCTHPEHRGQGLAAGLIAEVARRIAERGETPFLTSYSSNAGAIALYRRLGFDFRRQLELAIFVAV